MQAIMLLERQLQRTEDISPPQPEALSRLRYHIIEVAIAYNTADSRLDAT